MFRHTYAVAPVFATVERACIKGMARAIGFDEETSDGILMPGGTLANISACITARHAMFPHVKRSGYAAGERPVMFTSAQAHYSIPRGAMLAGIGMESCIGVPCHRDGTMDTDALDQALTQAKAAGQTPFFVSATAGTTVLGAFDPFVEIKKVVDKHSTEEQKIWLHVDGAWGGSVCFSKQHRHLMKGAEMADSMTWNFQRGSACQSTVQP